MEAVSRLSTVADLLDRADAARAAGRGEAAARLYDEAVARCREAGDLQGWTRAVLSAASLHVFGVEPGKLPAQLYDVLARTTDDADRARLAAALARCWSYAGHPGRGARFADEAVERADRAGDPGLVADCLDAALAAHWGPDELDVRRDLARQLDEVAAHVLAPDARLQAHLWGLQVACEALDLQAMHRQMRALEHLGEESARARFFAASRRLMLDLLRGRTDTAAHLTAVAAEAAEQAGLADAWMVVKSMGGYTGVQAGDPAAVTACAADCEAFALAEGATAVCAEAAYLWASAGAHARAAALVNTFHGSVLDDLPRDVNWLLTLQCGLEAALAVGDLEVVRAAARLLGRYEGRAVFNAGAVLFHGVTDDTLARAAAVLGDPGEAARLHAQAIAVYERIGAQWWRNRLTGAEATAEEHGAAGERDAGNAGGRRLRLHPVADGLWLVGPEQAAVHVRGLRGFTYLRELLRRPHRPVAVLDLVGEGKGVAVQAGLGEVLDRQALVAYKRRLDDIDRELDEAEHWSDLGRLDNLQTERDALIAELGRATGLGGRVRTTGDIAERARIAVRKAIAAGIDRLARVDESLARHLRVSIHTGLTCTYQPADDAPDWILDEGDPDEPGTSPGDTLGG
jgi:hypothetical protein